MKKLYIDLFSMKNYIVIKNIYVNNHKSKLNIIKMNNECKEFSVFPPLIHVYLGNSIYIDRGQII